MLVVVDRLTKYYFLPLKHYFTVKEVANLFAKEVIRLYRYPSSIVLERVRLL